VPRTNRRLRVRNGAADKIRTSRTFGFTHIVLCFCEYVTFVMTFVVINFEVYAYFVNCRSHMITVQLSAFSLFSIAKP